MERELRAEAAVEMVEQAGNIALGYFSDLDTLSIEKKGHQDLVSEADREVELFLRRSISRQFPDDGILGEEFGSEEGNSGFTWVIDPIDGTANFVSGIPAWTVVLAVTSGKTTQVGVIRDP